MRYITFDEYLAAANVTNEQLKVRRQRDLKSGSQIALAFGRGNNHGYQTDRYIELDAVAVEALSFSRIAKLPMKDEARRIAVNIAKLSLCSGGHANVEAVKLKSPL
jgi:hypothetical protein